MKRNTRLFTLVLSALLLFGGCRSTDGGGENKIPEIPAGIITADDLPDNTGATGILTHIFTSAGELVPAGIELYSNSLLFDTETGTLRGVGLHPDSGCFYGEFREGAGIVCMRAFEVPEDRFLKAGAVRGNTFAYILEKNQLYTESNAPDLELFLADAETGESLGEADLTGLFRNSGAGWVNITGMKIDADGAVLVLSEGGGGQIAVFSPDLSLIRIDPLPSGIASPELIADPDGTPYIVYRKIQDNVWIVAPFDKESGKTGDEILLAGDTAGYSNREHCVTDAGEFVWRDDTGVWVLREQEDGTASPELLMSWQNSNCKNGEIKLCAAPSTELFLLSDGEFSSWGTPSLWQSSDDVDLLELRVIELCSTIQIPDYVSSAVVEFNKTHPGIRIAVKDYYTSTGYWDAPSKLLLDILTGAYRPDIVIGRLGENDMNYFREHGMTLDLGTFLDADPLVNRENVFGCVQRVFATEDGGMWAIPDEFEVKTLVGPDSGIGAGNDGWTLAELLDYIEGLPRDMILMQGLTKQNAASKLLGQNGYGAFFDREKGTCSFDDPLYLRWLDFLLSLPKDEAELKKSSEFERMENEEKYEIYWNGKVALSSLTISDFSSVLSPTFTFGTREWSFVGYPSDGGGPGTTVESELVFAVMSWAEEPDESWEFIRSVVSEEDGISHIRFLGMSILKSNLRKELDIADKNVYSFYFQGGRGVTGKSYWDHTPTDADLREPGKMLEFLPEDGERLLSFLDADAGESAAKNMPDQVREIIDEEVSYLLGGVGTAERCAEKIQSRVSIWMAEHE